MLGPIEEKIGSAIHDFKMKPGLLESKLAIREDFAGLSDGFKKIFAQDRKDQRMVIPVAGFGGHRRGDKS